MKTIKWVTKPSKKVVSSFLYDHREAVKQVVIRYSLFYREDGLLVQFLALVSSPWLLTR